MLQDASTWVMTTRIVMMFAVLFYAVKTLYAMKRKVVYPLLRVSSETETIRGDCFDTPWEGQCMARKESVSSTHNQGGSMVTISQLMTRQLVALPAGTSVVEAARAMNNNKIGSVFVEQNESIVGIVTEPDIVRKVVGESKQPFFVSVESIMSSPVIGIDERRPITEAADLMQQHGTRHLAVMKSGAIVGVLSVRDLLQPVSIDEF